MLSYWNKLGNIFQPTAKSHPLLLTHASNPIALHLKDDQFRIYFNGRDHKNRSSIGAFDFDLIKKRIISKYVNPFFTYDTRNSFFSDGLSLGGLYTYNNNIYILFMGWQKLKNKHWTGRIGRLKVNLDHTLELDSTEPILDFDDTDKISFSYPCVIPRTTGGIDMWYGSTISWGSEKNEMVHVINHAFSDDGLNWKKNGLAIPYKIGVAQAFSRPSIIINGDGKYEMWFSYRSGKKNKLGILEKYRIGYAYSYDNKKWILDLNNVGIQPSSTGWDSEMIEYPFVFHHRDKIYMLYNGNNFGETGIGLAIKN